MRAPFGSREGFALPLILILLLFASVSAMALTGATTQQARSATTLSSSVRALQAAESGAAFIVNGLTSEDIPWPDDGEYEGDGIEDLSDDLPSGSPDDPNHGTASWWVQSIEIDGNDATIRVVGQDASESAARTIEVIYEKGTPGGANAYETSVVGCSGVTFSGSGSVDSYNSQLGNYNAGTAGSNADVTNLSGNVNLSGSTVIKGDLNIAGNLAMSGSAGVTGTIGSTGTIAFTGSPICPTQPARAAGAITKPGAWWCPSAPLQPNTPVTAPSGTCDPLGVNDFVVGQLNDAQPAPGDFVTGNYSAWLAAPVNFTTNKAFSPNFTVASTNTINFASSTVDEIFVNGNLSASGSSTIRIQAPVTPGEGGLVRIFVKGDITLSGAARLIVDPGAAVEIYTTGRVNISGSVLNQNLKPTITTIRDGETITVPSLSIFSSFSGTNGVSLSGAAQLHASVYAPLTPVTVSGSGGFFGAVRGSTVNVSGAGGIHYDERLASAQSGFALEGGGSRVTQWSEIF